MGLEGRGGAQAFFLPCTQANIALHLPASWVQGTCQGRGQSNTGVDSPPPLFTVLLRKGGLCCPTDPHVAVPKVESVTSYMPRLGAVSRWYGNRGFHGQRAWEILTQMGFSVFPMQGPSESSICIVFGYSPEGAVESGLSTSFLPVHLLPSAVQRAFWVWSSTPFEKQGSDG